jgi:hypothetical protein
MAAYPSCGYCVLWALADKLFPVPHRKNGQTGHREKNSHWGHPVKALAELILITPPLFGNRSERRPALTHDDPPDQKGDMPFYA